MRCGCFVRVVVVLIEHVPSIGTKFTKQMLSEKIPDNDANNLSYERYRHVAPTRTLFFKSQGQGQPGQALLKEIGPHADAGILNATS